MVHEEEDAKLVLMQKLSSTSRILVQCKIRLTDLLLAFAHLPFYFLSLDLSLLHSCLKYPAPVLSCLWNLGCFQNLPAQPIQYRVFEVLPKLLCFAICKSLIVSSKNRQHNQITRTINTNYLFTTWRQPRGQKTVGVMFKLQHC